MLRPRDYSPCSKNYNLSHEQSRCVYQMFNVLWGESAAELSEKYKLKHIGKPLAGRRHLGSYHSPTKLPRKSNTSANLDALRPFMHGSWAGGT